MNASAVLTARGEQHRRVGRHAVAQFLLLNSAIAGKDELEFKVWCSATLFKEHAKRCSLQVSSCDARWPRTSGTGLGLDLQSSSLLPTAWPCSYLLLYRLRIWRAVHVEIYRQSTDTWATLFRRNKVLKLQRNWTWSGNQQKLLRAGAGAP